jgi:hypothetical protein
MYYGLPLDNVYKTIEITDKFREEITATLTEHDFFLWLKDQNRCNVKAPQGDWQEGLMIFGRRGCKTSIASLAETYETYKLLKKFDPLEYYGLLREDTINLTNLANTRKQASKLFTVVKSYIEKTPFFQQYVVNKPKNSEIELRTEADLKYFKKSSNRASVILGSHGCNSRALRGGGNIKITFDELAWFLDNGGNQSDEQIYNAMIPSVGDYGLDGRILSLSSPRTKAGKVYELYLRSLGGGPNDGPDESILMLHIPTWIANPNINSKFLRTRWNSDGSERFVVEFGAEFSERIEGFIPKEEYLLNCIELAKQNERVEQSRGKISIRYFYGNDLGLSNDGTAHVIVHADPVTDNVVLDYGMVQYPGVIPYEDVDRLQMTKHVVPVIKNLCSAFRIVGGVFDQYCAGPLEDELVKEGLKQFSFINFTDRLNDEVFSVLYSLIVETRFEPYENHVLLQELLELQKREGAKYKVVRAPTMVGKHDDFSYALARACWAVKGGLYKYLGTSPTVQNPVSIVSTKGGLVVSKSTRSTPIESGASRHYQALLRNQQFKKQYMQIRASRMMRGR